MISKAQIKLLKSLRLKKNREEIHLFIAEGKKIVEELLQSSTIEVVHVYAAGNYFGNTPFTHVTGEEMKQISSLTTPPSIMALCRIPEEPLTMPRLENELALVLDNIRDPGNLGSIIRIADWFGIGHIFCTPECVDAYNPKTVQASMGSIARVQVDYTNLRTVLQECAGKQLPVYGAKLDGTSILKEKLSTHGLLVIGNESNGISPELGKYITHAIKIPSYRGGAESLNAAMATAILCAEFRREGMKTGN